MLCQRCQKNEATIHITVLRNGERHGSNLCEQCAKADGMVFKNTATIDQLLNQLSAPVEPAPPTQYISNAQSAQQADQVAKRIDIFGYAACGLAILAGFLGTVDQIPTGVDLLSLPLAGLGLFFGVMGTRASIIGREGILNFPLAGAVACLGIVVLKVGAMAGCFAVP